MFFSRTRPSCSSRSARCPAATRRCRCPRATKSWARRCSRPSPRASSAPCSASGCFWGAERVFWQAPGVYTTAVGYAGGYTPNPTYEEVCSARDRPHRGRARRSSTPPRPPTRRCCKLFWENHDPTQGMRQGNDVGTQYRSAIYWTTDAQRERREAPRARPTRRELDGRRLRRDHDRDRRGGRRSTTPRTTTSSTSRRTRTATAGSAARASAARSVCAHQRRAVFRYGRGAGRLVAVGCGGQPLPPPPASPAPAASAASSRARACAGRAPARPTSSARPSAPTPRPASAPPRSPRELVEQLGQMRGAAMKIGQVLSTVDFTAIPEDEREEFKRTLAALRDDVPPLPFKRGRASCCASELGGRLADVFAEFDERGVRRRLDRPGPPRGHARRPRRGGQGPVPRHRRGGRDRPAQPRPAAAAGQAARARARRQGARRRAARARSPRSSTTRSRRRTTAPIARAWRGHPFVHVPAVDTRLSSRRVLVTELLEGRRFEEVKQLGEAERDRFAEIVFRFFFGTLSAPAPRVGRPAPGQLPAARRRPRRLPRLRAHARGRRASTSSGERALARAVVGAATPRPCTRGMAALGYLPDPATLRARAAARPAAARRRVVLRARLPAHHAGLRERPDGARLLAALAVLRGHAPA